MAAGLNGLLPPVVKKLLKDLDVLLRDLPSSERAFLYFTPANRSVNLSKKIW